MAQVSWGFRSTTAILPHASPHSRHKKMSQRFRKQFAVLCGKGLFVSMHKGCRRSFLAALAQGEPSQDSALFADFKRPMWNRLGRAPRKGQKWGFASPARQREGRRGGTILATSQLLLLPQEIRSKGKRGFLCASYASVKFSRNFLLVLNQVLDPCGQSPYCMMCLGYSLAKGFPLQSSM